MLAEALHADSRRLVSTSLRRPPGPTASGFAARADMRMGATVSPNTVTHETLAALRRRTTVLPVPYQKRWCSRSLRFHVLRGFGPWEPSCAA